MDGKDLDVLMCCAFRYAFGRRTYISQWIAEILTANVDKLSENSKQSMYRDIINGMQTDTAGMDCDRHAWTKLLEALLPAQQVSYLLDQ